MSNSRAWLIALVSIFGFAGAASAQFNNGAGVATASPPLVITAGNIACATCTTSAGALAANKILTGSGLQAMASSNVTLTNPATTATLTLADNSSLITVGAFAGTLTFTAASNATIPAGTHSLAPLDSPTFTGVLTANTISASTSGSSNVDGTFFQDLNQIKGYWDTSVANFNWVNENRVTGNVNVAIRAVAAQTADLQQWLVAGGTTTLAKMSILGGLTTTGNISGSTKFTLTGCAAGTTVGGATAGTFVSGTTGTCTVVITMNGATGLTAPTGWHCSASDRTTPANLFDNSASSTTTATLTGTTVSGDVISFSCMGY